MKLADAYNGSPIRAGGPTERSIRVVHSQPTFMQMKAAAKERYANERAELNYAATEPSQFRRTRNNLGGSADAHYAQEFRFWTLREYARDFVRNDIFVGQLFTKATDNILGTGLIPHPATDDDGLNDEIQERWQEWSETPQLCDYSYRHAFWKLEQLALRTMFVDGDSFEVVRREDGVRLQGLEGDRCASPDNVNDDVVHGVQLDYLTDRVQAYHFLRPKAGQRKQRVRRVPYQVASAEMVAIDAFTPDGRPNVLHVFDPERMTQNRGVTALAPCFDAVGMFEDINYARLVQQQVVSAIAAFVETERDFQYGTRQDTDNADGTTRVNEEIVPGIVHRLRPGEKIKPFTSGVPGPEFQQHVNLILRLISGNIGMPLELALMTTADTTFHGYRGVLQMARRAFMRIHRALTSRLHCPLYRELVTTWFPGNTNRYLLRHAWTVPGFPYVDPKVEAEADKIRSKNLLTSPRRLHAEQGNTWDDIQDEIVEDYGEVIGKAMAKAAELNKSPDADEDDKVTWRDVLNLDRPTGETRQVKEQIGEPPGQPGAPKPAPKKGSS